MERRKCGRKPLPYGPERIAMHKKNKREYNNAYMKRTLDSLRITVHKYKRIPELSDPAAEHGHAASKQAPVVNAIEEKLCEFGVSLTDLPPENTSADNPDKQ